MRARYYCALIDSLPLANLGKTINEGAITFSSHSVNDMGKLSLGIRVSIREAIKCPLDNTINEGAIT